MKNSIETNKNENQNDGLIFVSSKAKRLDGSGSTGSENHIMIKMSDLESLGINCESQYNTFKQTKKNGDFIADGDPCSVTKEYHKVKPGEPDVSLLNFMGAFSCALERSKIKYENCFKTMCSSNENIYGLRFCFTKGNVEKKLDKNASLDDPNLVWLELVRGEDGDKFLNKYNWQSKTWQSTNISFGLQDIWGGNDFYSNGQNTVLEMYPKKTKFLTHFISKDSISINENKSLSITNKIEADTGLKIGNVNVYACMQFKPNGPFYVDWNLEAKTAKYVVNGGICTMNDHEERMEDVLALRFYFTDQKLNVKVGDQFDNQLIKNAKKSVFEIRRDKNGNMVLWHYDLKKKTWLPVDATVQCETAVEEKQVIYQDQNCTIHSYKDVHKYACRVEKNTDESYSYTVNHSCTLDCHKPIFAEHFDSEETRNDYIAKLKDTKKITGDESEFYETKVAGKCTMQTGVLYQLNKIPKETFSSEVKYESIKVDMTKQIDLFEEKETGIGDEVYKFNEPRVGTENISTNGVINTDKHFNSQKKTTILYILVRFLKKHKSKIVFSVIVGIVTAFLFSLFSIVSSIFLVALSGFSGLMVSFLFLLVLDKFIECPSVEDWFRHCKPSCDSELNLSKDSLRNETPEVKEFGDTREPNKY